VTPRRMKWTAIFVVLFVSFTIVGALTAAPHRTRRLSCVWHGARAVQLVRHHHPGWSTYHAWRASQTCR
jgi:hypothetical protein